MCFCFVRIKALAGYNENIELRMRLNLSRNQFWSYYVHSILAVSTFIGVLFLCLSKRDIREVQPNLFVLLLLGFFLAFAFYTTLYQYRGLSFEQINLNCQPEQQKALALATVKDLGWIVTKKSNRLLVANTNDGPNLFTSADQMITIRFENSEVYINSIIEPTEWTSQAFVFGKRKRNIKLFMDRANLLSVGYD